MNDMSEQEQRPYELAASFVILIGALMLNYAVFALCNGSVNPLDWESVFRAMFCGFSVIILLFVPLILKDM